MDDTLIQRIPPNSAEAEEAILGCMLFDHEGLMVGVEGLVKDDFYKPNNREIFECMRELYIGGHAVDIVTLKNRLDEKNLTNTVGGIQYIADLMNSVATSTNAKEYVGIIKNKATLRKLIKMSGDIQGMSYKSEDSVESIIEYAEKGIFEVVQNINNQDFSHMSEVLTDAIESIENVHMNMGNITGVATGFSDFDRQTAGMQPSDLILLAARPSMGKTAFALNLAQNAALKSGKTVAIFSLEMSKEQLVNRMLCAEAMVDAQKLRTGNLESSDWDKIAGAIEPLANANIYIDDTASISITDLKAKCRKLKLDKGLDMVLIDYLQLMSGSGKGESRQQEISEISRSLKALAREIEAPVIALSQLSRACEQRTDHRPMLSDLRESGAIEQDADVVCFLYRDEYYHPDNEEQKGMAELIVAKQRNGPTGTIKLMWLNSNTRFVDYTDNASGY